MIRELKTNFIGTGEVRGFVFEQLAYNGKRYLYKVTTPFGRCYYEVFSRRINKTHGLVRYPKGKAFGFWALTTPRYDRAMRLFEKGFL